MENKERSFKAKWCGDCHAISYLYMCKHIDEVRSYRLILIFKCKPNNFVRNFRAPNYSFVFSQIVLGKLSCLFIETFFFSRVKHWDYMLSITFDFSEVLVWGFIILVWPAHISSDCVTHKGAQFTQSGLWAVPHSSWVDESVNPRPWQVPPLCTGGVWMCFYHVDLQWGRPYQLTYYPGIAWICLYVWPL